MKNNNFMDMRKGLLSVLALCVSVVVCGQGIENAASTAGETPASPVAASMGAVVRPGDRTSLTAGETPAAPVGSEQQMETFGAQLDLQSRATLRAMRGVENGKQKPAKLPASLLMPLDNSTSTTGEGCQMVGAMVRVKEGTTREQIEAEGLQVLAMRGNIAVVSMPMDEVETIAAQSQVIRQMQLPRAVKPMNDKARLLTGVDAIHAGTGLPQAYTGKGVVTGIVDAGIDPNHVMFKRANDTSRVEYLTYYIPDSKQPNGIGGAWYNRTNMDEFSTDDPTTFHGTHTLGTMAGGFMGASTVAELSESGVTLNKKANPYYGMAMESDIVASCGTLQDVFIALGLISTLDYAEQMQMPAVVNLSLGGTTGPHDGTSMISEYMAIAERDDKVIICVAAGNEGDQPLVVSKTLTEGDTEVKTFMQPMYASYPVEKEDGTTYTYTNLRYGQVYVYSNDSTPFTIKAVVYNKDRGTITFEAPFRSDNENGMIYYASPDYAKEGDLTHTNFTNAFKGYVGLGGEVDKYSGRYYAMVEYFVEDNTAKNDGKYLLGFVVSGKAGQRIDCYCDGSFS